MKKILLAFCCLTVISLCAATETWQNYYTTALSSHLLNNIFTSGAIGANNSKWVPSGDLELYELTAGQITFTSQQNWYVKPSAQGTGSSWSNALGDLATALQMAEAGDSIFVAAGTYQPAPNTAFIMKDGVKILGGFIGTETTYSQRNLSAGHTSILKGNGSSVIANLSNGLTSSALLDGFTLTAGTGTLDHGYTRGGAIYNFQSSPLIAHCVFAGNKADIGGAIDNESNSSNITDCVFKDNKVQSSFNGGAIAEQSTQSVYKNCIFSNNAAGSTDGQAGAGGALSLSGSNDTFCNCLFYGNSASGSGDAGGGAMAIDGSTVSLSNCTFYGNHTTALQDIGHGPQILSNTLSVDGFGSSTSSVQIVNSIIYGPEASQLFTTHQEGITLDHSIVKGYVQDLNMDGKINSQDITQNNPDLTNPLFVDVVSNDYHLKPASPCINAGIVTNATSTDLAGNTRTVNGYTDLGAYQNQGLQFASSPGQSISSNRADTASDGYIYLYNSALNTVICSVNPAGQNLGNMTASGMLTSLYGSGNPTTLNAPFGNTGKFYILNRAWHVNVANTVFNQPVTVRYFIDTTDLKDLIGVLPGSAAIPHSLEEWKALAPLFQLYKVAGDNAYDPAAQGYKQYTYSTDNTTVDTHHFIIGQYQQLYYLEFMVSEFSSGALAYSPAATPVVLVDFSGQLNNGTVQIHWQTGEETNFKQFELQKSIDSKTFTTITTIQPTGNNSHYNQATTQSEANAYYRLKLLDLDGKASYSKIIQLTQPIEPFSIHPNPAKDYINISSNQDGILYIYSLTGQQLLSVHINNGDNRINIAHLAAGIYFIRMNDQKVKLIKR